MFVSVAIMNNGDEIMPCKHQWKPINTTNKEENLMAALYGNVERCSNCGMLRVNNPNEEPYYLNIKEG